MGSSSRVMLSVLSKTASTRRFYRTFSVFLPIFKRPIDYMNSKAVIDANGSYTHGGLLNSARILAKEISGALKGRKQERVVYLMPRTAESVIMTWAIWMSGQVAVPLLCEQPHIAHEYFIVDSEPTLIVVTEDFKNLGEAVRNTAKCPLLVISPQLKETAKCNWVQDANNPENTLIDDSSFKDLKLSDLGHNDSFYRKASALILYTSGATPKGVVFSHTSLHAQAASLVDAWRLSKRDCFLQAEPSERSTMLIMYLAPLTVGARVVMLDRLNPENIWINMLGLRKKKDERPNIILTQSQILPKLIKVYEKSLKKSDVITDHIRNKCLDQIRFFSVGNSPITKKIFQLWEDITGHQISSHFSTTETGMVMSTPIYGCKSSSSSVGMPLPGVHVRLTNENGVGLVAEGSRAGTRILGNTQPVIGLLEVRGENILSGYWRKPTTTHETLTRDGWFKTNDLVKYSRGMYSIIGQSDTNVYRRGDLR